MSRSRQLHDSLQRLAAAEQRFLGQEFLAPMLRGGRVQVRLAGVVCRLRVEPTDFEGWAVCRAQSYTEATLVRQARLAERQRFLDLFRPRTLIVCARVGANWLAAPAQLGDRRYRDDGPVPIRLADEMQLFETVCARFDGTHHWFECRDTRGDPASAHFLRQALLARTRPEDLARPGLTGGQRAAYALAYRLLLEEERDRVEDRLRAALAHAGAQLEGYAERGDAYRLEYRVDGQRHVSVVSQHDLTVQVAGICLSGTDRHFDLHSLVGVLREAEAEGGALRVGDQEGISEEAYWRAHPPRG